jgi:hypothetical protein
MMNCRDCRERLSDLLEDDFASNEAPLRAELRSHLETCVACKGEWELLRAVREELRAFVEVSAPANLPIRVRAQLIQQKPSKTAANTPLGSIFRLPRLALSGGAVLAACCLLLLVNSSPFQDSLFPNQPNSAPLTTDNFRVSDNAFQETPEEKKQREASEKAAKTNKQTKNPTNRAPRPANSSPVSTESPIETSPTIENPTRVENSKNDGDSRANAKIRGERIGQGLNSPHIAKNSRVAVKNGAKPEAKGTQPNATRTKGMNQSKGSEPPAKITPQGANDITLMARSTRPDASALGMLSVPVEPHKPSNLQGLAGASGLNLNTSDGFEPGQVRAKGPLVAEAPSAESVVPFTAPPAIAPTAPSLMADAGTGARISSDNSAQSFQSATPGVPGLMRGPGRGALTSRHGAPVALAAQQVDYVFAPNTMQIVNLSLVPEQDAPLAQVRVTLPSGLRFADEIKAESKPKDESKKRAAVKPEGQTDTSRILWRGPAPKGTAIENAVELKGVAQGRHTVVLTLESLDGKPLQVKNVLFHIQDPQASETLKATPGEAN